MKVKIVKCSYPDPEEEWWYSDRIGDVLEVRDSKESKDDYVPMWIKGEDYYILKSDCEIVEQ